MIVLRDASGLNNIGAIFLRDASGLVEIGEVYLRESGGLVEVYSAAGAGDAFTVDVPPNVYGYASSLSSVSVTTGIATATPTGGTAPYTYLWSGGDENWTITNPNSQSTAFRAASVPPADGFVTSFICTVTDDNDSIVVSGSVSAEAYNFGGYE